MPNKIKICHVSSVHLSMDTRIFYRYCLGLKQTYEVSLIACHPKNDIIQGIPITSFPRYKNRIFRVLFGWLLILPKALRQKAKLYHLHDPELIPLGFVLKLFGKKIIYDIHENIAEDILEKDWIKFKKMWHWLYTLFEKPALKLFHIILAEDSYLKRYNTKSNKAMVIHNYCDLNFFNPYYQDSEQRNSLKLFYIGILLENRGILEILTAIKIAKSKGFHFEFHCVAELYTQVSDAINTLDFYPEIASQVTFYGRKNLEDGYEIAKKCGIGLCIIHPMSNSIESYPTKLFEYMAVGLPIVTSDFDLYKEAVSENGCGLNINPLNPEEIAEAIIHISENKELQKSMSQKGKKAVADKYNWNSELPKLMKFYSNILDDQN